MKVCLISPPTLTEFNERLVAESEALRLIAQHAPIGILSLGAVLEQHGVQTELVDLNRLYYQYANACEQDKNDGGFCSYASAILADMAADVFGFSTICSSYPLTLRLARNLRARHPEVSIIFGGPQASVVDVATLTAFPFVDLIVRGEAERTLPRLIESLAGNSNDLASLLGVTYRKGSEIVRNANAPVIEDLDSLPLPAFHLYPHISDCDYSPIEAGRGCPFACSFCSTNDFFRRRFRLKSPQVLVEQMKSVKKSYGIDSFDLVHDMFTVDRKKVLAFCDAVESSGEELYWSCSARTDCIDDELIARMAETGCCGIFFGIDTGSERMQGIIQKRLDLADAAARIKCSNRHKIKTTVSLITGFPEETMADLSATIHFLGESLHHQHADVQLHILAPLAETPITSQYREQLIYDDIFSDMSFQGWEQDAEDRAMIIEHRDIFPNFYGVPTQGLDRHYLCELREFVLHGILRHSWLMLLLHRDSGNLLRVFDQWLEWSRKARSAETSVDSTRRYYAGQVFSPDLLRFVQSHYVSVATHPHLLRALAEVEQVQLSFCDAPVPSGRKRMMKWSSFKSLNAVPVLSSDARVVQVGADYKKLMRALKRNERLDRISEGPVPLVFLREREDTRIIQLNGITYELMRLCNGARTITEIASEFSSIGDLGVLPIKASMYGVASLAQQGLIDISYGAN